MGAESRSCQGGQRCAYLSLPCSHVTEANVKELVVVKPKKDPISTSWAETVLPAPSICMMSSFFVLPADINECKTGRNTCANDTVCFNLEGGYDCRCPHGHNCTGDCIHDNKVKHSGQIWVLDSDRCSVCSCQVRNSGRWTWRQREREGRERERDREKAKADLDGWEETRQRCVEKKKDREADRNRGNVLSAIDS